MKTRIRVLTVLSFVMLLVFACNLPGISSPLSTEEQAATFVAQTLNASPGEPGGTLQPNAPAATPTQNAGGPVGTTPTSSTPLLKVDEPTNCRSGPGQNFEIVTVFQAGSQAQIVGRSQGSDWWLINNPFGSGTCWIAAEFAEITGNGSAVQVVTPLPSTNADLPPPPSISNWDFSCAYDSGGPNVTFNLRWIDRAVDEIGYRIYRNNEMVAELPPDSSSFSEVVAVEENEQMTYRLEVYNNAGASSASLINFSCR
jgi:uncharacterized protein YraI